MRLNKKLLLSLLTFVSLNLSAEELTRVNLSEYGDISDKGIAQTLSKAIKDLDGKCLVLPSQPINIEDLTIASKNNFKIEGDTRYPIKCRKFRIENCNNFELDNLFFYGTKDKFASVYIVGDCDTFSIHDCKLDSEKGPEHYTIYGIHIVADTNNPKMSFENSPRNFSVYNNTISNTRYDGILAHAFCSNIDIYENTITNSECIGIEIEGRIGDNTNTKVSPCRNAKIHDNHIKDCGDWGILVMWTDMVDITNNKSHNCIGAFLSVGCSNLNVVKNHLEGTEKGFEISNEFYSIEKGINDNVTIANNTIIAKSRYLNRGVVDLRHAKNVIIKKNKITTTYREESACFSVGSSQYVTINKNKISASGKPVDYSILYYNISDRETKAAVPQLDVKDVTIQRNNFFDCKEKVKVNDIDVEQANCKNKRNLYY